LAKQLGTFSLQRRQEANDQGRTANGGSMDISDWRKKIDDLDRQLVNLISQRAQAAHEIGKLKRNAGMPIYEPDRERAVFDNATKINPGPLPDRDLLRIYERIMDVMRQIQREEIAPQAVADAAGSTEVDSKVND
jgi:chorismate mutase-like protein